MMLSLMNTEKPCALWPNRSSLKKNTGSHKFLAPNILFIEAEDHEIGADRYTLASQSANMGGA